MKPSHNGSRTSVVLLALMASLGTLGCDAGSKSNTPDDIAADSALAADLALANRDTLLVDSIGAFTPRDGTTADDTALVDADLDPSRTGSTPVTPPAALPAPNPQRETRPPADSRQTPPPPATPRSTVQPPSRSTPASVPPTAAPAARRTGASACNSPTPADQQACVKSTLASTDMRLNRIYRALITEMRRKEGVGNGAKDPPSVQRLRVAQRAWLVYRDTECRRRGRGKEGRLWARPRVKCLGEFSARRANELADSFSRLTAS